MCRLGKGVAEFKPPSSLSLGLGGLWIEDDDCEPTRDDVLSCTGSQHADTNKTDYTPCPCPSKHDGPSDLRDTVPTHQK